MTLGSIKRIICLFPQKICVGIIKLYQIIISPLFPASCRFYPTCSQYGITALKRFGFIIRCRPGGDYGYDPVPETWDERN